MGKKYNKSKKQKPNYSKRGIKNVDMELGSDYDFENKLKDPDTSSSSCSESVKNFKKK